MKALYVRKLFLWPRFQAAVKETLEDSVPVPSEVLHPFHYSPRVAPSRSQAADLTLEPAKLRCKRKTASVVGLGKCQTRRGVLLARRCHVVNTVVYVLFCRPSDLCQLLDPGSSRRWHCR